MVAHGGESPTRKANDCRHVAHANDSDLKEKPIMIELVNKFQELNLEDYPVDQINHLIAEIGRIPIMRSEYNAGKVIYRARPHSNEDEDFLNVSDLSYKPEKFNTKYQRASTPSRTMFYGAIIPELPEGDLIDDERIIGAFEVIDFLRNLRKKKGEKVISYGVWRVNSLISTYAIIPSDPGKTKVSWLRKLAENFNENLKGQHGFKDKAPIIQDFLAEEFSKQVEDGKDYNYLISAMFSNKVCELGVDGVLYPSVKMKGTGLNIALTSECVDSRLTLVDVIKCKVYKKCKEVIINNLKRGTVDQNTGAISWKDIPLGKYRAPEDYFREQLSKVYCSSKRKRKKSKKEKMMRLIKKRERKNNKRRKKTNH
jgi:hypothetical protein